MIIIFLKYILDNNPLSDVSFANINIFFQSVACLLILLILSTDNYLLIIRYYLLILSTSEQKFYILIVDLINYFFHISCL